MDARPNRPTEGVDGQTARARSSSYEGTYQFEHNLQKAIEETLILLLGPRGRDAMYSKFKELFKLEPTRLAGASEELASALDILLGKIPSAVVGRAIMRRLAVEYGTKLRDRHDIAFPDYVDELRVRFSSQGAQV